MLSQQLVVALRPEDEVGVASELAVHLEGQAFSNAPASDRAAAESAEALLPVEEVSRASIPSDAPRACPYGHHLTITPETLKKFRRGYGEEAAIAADQIKQIVITSAEGILRKARLVLDMKSRLNRKEWGVWLREVLGWFGNEATQYLQIAKAFCDFDPAVFCDLEPFAILKLRTKRYAPVVARLREELALTSQLVQDFIKQLLPRQSRKKVEEPISGWKQSRSGGGRYYNVLLHSEEVGLSIERMAESEAILPQKVIAEAVALRAQHKSSDLVQVSKYYAAQMEELPIVVEQARSLAREKRQLELELSKHDRLIASLEAKLASGAAVPPGEPDGVQTDEGSVAASELEAPLESLPLALAPEQITEIEPLMALQSDCKKPEQKSEYLELGKPGDLRSEKQEDAQDLGAEHNNVLHSGDLVEINVTRLNGDKTWNGSRAYVQNEVTATGKVAVLLQGDYRSKQFFSNELRLVELLGEERQTSVVTEGVDECPPFQDLEAEARPDIADGSDVESEAAKAVLTEAVASRSAAPNSKLLPIPEQKPQSNRNLQPVEILTTAGEWIGGYFVHACISVGNLVNSDRQFTLFDANGQMYRFSERIRPPQGCVTR